MTKIIGIMSLVPFFACLSACGFHAPEGNIGAFGAQMSLLDMDSDFVVNGMDNCPTLYNPGQFDLDSDKVGDACDINVTYKHKGAVSIMTRIAK